MKSAPLPIRGISGNLVLSRDVWAGFSVRCRSYRAEPERSQAALVSRLAEFARVVDADFQILRVSRVFSPDEHVGRLRRGPARRPLWDRYLTEQRVLLEDLNAWTPEVFVFVCLEDPGLDVYGHATRLFDRTPAERWREFSAPKVRTKRLRSLDVAGRAQIVEGCARSVLDARPATFQEVQWLIRRSFVRGLAEPVVSPPDAMPDEEEPERMVRRWFGEYGVEHDGRSLWSVGEYGDSYQAGLCLGEMDHARPFTRQVELMFTALEEYPWPIDAALNVRFLPNDRALRQTERQFKRTSAQLSDEEESEYGAMNDGYERQALARELHGRLKTTGEPILMGTLSFLVSAPTGAELNRRVRIVKRGFPWDLYRPYGDQLDLWKQHLPGQPSRVGGYERPFTPEQIGAMVPHGTHEAGSSTSRSLYVAKTLHGHQPVFFDLREGSGTDRPTTVALVSTLGGGKTVFLQLLMYQAFLQDALVVDVDPKGDHRFHEHPDVAPHVQRIRLSPDAEHAGKLDPLRIAPDGERHDSAATFLVDVLHDPDDEVRAAINGAVQRVMDKHGAQACCSEVVAELEREGERAGRLLKQYAEAGIVRLGFAKLKDPLVTAAAKPVTYLNVRALKRAGIETVRSEMSQSQRHGRAVLQLVALYAMKILGEERNRLKVLSFDEASFLTQDALGQQLLDTLTRWGRSELAVPILSTQLLEDVQGQDNLIGHWFVFKMESREDAARALRTLGLDAEGPLAEALTERYGKGMAVYRDLSGRCEEIQVDLGREGLLEAFSTTPVEAEEEPDALPSLAELAKTL